MFDHTVFHDISVELQVLSHRLVLSENFYINGGSWSERLRHFQIWATVVFRITLLLVLLKAKYLMVCRENLPHACLLSWYKDLFVCSHRQKMWDVKSAKMCDKTVELHDQSNNFHRTNSNAMCSYRNEVDCCLIFF